MRLIGAYDPATYTCTVGGAMTPAPAPAPDVDGLPLTWTSYSTAGAMPTSSSGSGKLKEVGKPYAIPEGSTRSTRSTMATCRSTSGRPTPTRTSRTRPITRAASVSSASTMTGIKEQGHYIDGGGNNFWGVEQFTTSGGERLIAASDRDYGLYIFRYGGPDAPPDPRLRRRRRRRRRRPRAAAGTGLDARGEGHDEAADHVAVAREPAA